MTAEQKRNALEVTPVQNGHVKTNGTHALHNGSVPSPPARPRASTEDDTLEECTLWVAFITYLAYFILVAVGYVKEFLFPVHQKEKGRQGYTPLYLSFESFYIRNVYRRMSACFNSPLAGCPGGEIDIQLRETPDYGFSYRRTGAISRCVNLGSYNYLGFAESSGPCTDTAERLLRQHGISSCSSRLQLVSCCCCNTATQSWRSTAITSLTTCLARHVPLGFLLMLTSQLSWESPTATPSLIRALQR